jgi:RNA polymerase sigma factor (sigma-70 family)
MVAASTRVSSPEMPPSTLASHGVLAHLPELRRAARRASRVPEDADDLLQDALLELVRSGRHDLESPGNLAWFHGVLRNLAAMTARSSVRRRSRDDHWNNQLPVAELPPWWLDYDLELESILQALPSSLRKVARLAISGHDRREIAWLLGLRDETLRQRIAALRRRLANLDRELVGFALDQRGDHTGGELSSKRWPLDLLRRALLPVARFSQGAGVSDPDGHMVVMSTPGSAKKLKNFPHDLSRRGNKLQSPSETGRAEHHQESLSASLFRTRRIQ